MTVLERVKESSLLSPLAFPQLSGEDGRYHVRRPVRNFKVVRVLIVLQALTRVLISYGFSSFKLTQVLRVQVFPYNYTLPFLR